MVITPRVEVTTGGRSDTALPSEFFPWNPVEAADLSTLDVLMQAEEIPTSAHVGSQEVSVGQRVSSLRHGGGVTCEWDDKMLQQGTI